MRDYRFTGEKFRSYLDKSLSFCNPDKYDAGLLEEMSKLLNDIDADVEKLAVARDAESSKYIKKLLIGFLGQRLKCDFTECAVSWGRLVKKNPI